MAGMAVEAGDAAAASAAVLTGAADAAGTIPVVGVSEKNPPGRVKHRRET